MKTVTNYAEKKAKQFLNLLQGYTKGIRMTAILILLLLGVVHVSAANMKGGEVLYLKPNSNWTSSNAWFAMFLCNGTSGDKWVKMTKSGDYYMATVPTGDYKNVIFCRMNNANTTKLDWSNRWNQTADLSFDQKKNCCTITGWDKSSSWSTYQPVSNASLTSSAANIYVGGQATLTAQLSSNTNVNTLKSTSYAISPNTGASISGNTFTATAAGTYTVTATITYYPTGCTSLTSDLKTATATATITVANPPANSHNITYNNGAGWTYGAKPTSAKEGAAVTFEVIPTTGYTVTVTSSDVSLSKNGNIYTFTMPTKDVTINVSATENTHDVTVSYKCGDQTIQNNETVTAVGEVTSKEITAPEITGYKFTSWTLDNGITNKSANTTTNPINITTKASGTYTLTANYEKVVTVYFVNSSKWSTVTCHHWVSKDNTAGTTWPGDQLTTTGETVNEFDVYKATFTNAHTMCIFNNNGGGLQTENLEVQDGKYYYLLKNQWYDSLNDIPAIDPLATNVFIAGGMNGWSTNTDEFRKATKEATTASIILNLTEGTYNFKIIDNGTWLGNTGTMTRNNCSGWTFEKLDGGDETNCKINADFAGDYTFTWAISTKKLSVSYPTIYAITATANDAAMGTIAGTGEYGKGSTATLTATPNDGYLFVNWTKGGEVVATTQEYSFEVTEAVELVANFEAAPEEVHNVTVFYVCDGDTIAEDQTVAAVGVTTAKTVEAPEIWGYTFSSWTLGAGVTSADATANPISINIVADASDYTLTANYTEIPKVTIYFVNNKKWSKVYAYGWGGSVGENPAWPGQDITANKEAEQIVGFDVYSYSVVPGSYGNIIFNKGEGGEGNQTETFKWTDGKYYYMGADLSYTGGTKDEVTAILEDEVLATNVYLAGDMTTWDEGKLQFRKKAAGDAVATVSVELTEGEHKFKIIEDGKWLGNNGTMTRENHENWTFREKQDDGTTDEVDATIDADANGTYTFAWNSDRNELTVTYPAPTAKYIYFKNNPGWSKVYVYFFENDKYDASGASSSGLTAANKRFGAMTRVGNTDIWQYEYGTTGVTPGNVIAFTEASQPNYEHFHNTKAAYRADFNKKMELFIPQKASNSTKNGTKYYSNGLWMKYNSTESGYVFANNIDANWKDDPFETDAPGGYHFETTETLEGNTTYYFKVKSVNNDWFRTSTVVTSTKNTDIEFKAEDGGDNVQLQTTSAGDYTISIDLSEGKMMVSVEYPLQANDYRLVYVESDVLGQAPYTKFHAAQSIRYQAEGENKDTISFYVNTAKNPAILLQQCTSISGSNITWEDIAIQAINGNGGADPVGALAPASNGCPNIDGNGVYNFVLEQTNTNAEHNAQILSEETHPYEGDYYIRTNAAEGGWRKYNTNPDNIMTYSRTALDYGGYDYYFCKWVKANTNVSYAIANKYSYQISDILGTGDFTNNDSEIPHDANVRFTWNSSTNAMSRAYINGSGDVKDRYLVLIGDDNLKDLEGNTFDIDGLYKHEANFQDMGNWLYQLEVKASDATEVKLTANYNGKIQYFKGSEGKTEKLIAGAKTEYPLRLVYDFKTNYFISGLINVDNSVITDPITLKEVMIIRPHHEEAKTIKVSGAGSVTAEKIYGVMTFDKTILNDNNKEQYARALYWVSFPFDVNLNEVFGFGNYGEHWIMEYYDGKERAEKGLWKEPTYSYWKYITNPNNTLEAGKGYVLCLDLDLLGEDATFWYNGNTEIALYFPSAGGNITINSEPTLATTILKPLACTIERDNRKEKDSNWNIIGVPSYANANLEHGARFYYNWNPADNSYQTNESTTNTTFNTMHAYMVQYEGTINWAEGTVPQAIAARRNAAGKDQHTLRLAIQQEGEQQDHTFIRLQEDNATAEFDMNYDLCKIINRGANIYSMINDVEVAANVLPMQETTIPLGVEVDATDTYTFAMPDGTDGITAILIDYVEGTETNLLFSDYTTTLNKGINNNRFALRVRPNHVATEVETIIDGANGQIQKYIINGALYILNNGQLYDAQGRMVQP